MNIVIMGATSHIAKGLIERFLLDGKQRLTLFSRSADAVKRFLNDIGRPIDGNCAICSDYSEFSAYQFDIIINCVGVETRNKHNCDFTRYFSVTEEFDDMAIGYLKFRNPKALYISFSSGAVYGRGFAKPADESSLNCLPVNHIAPEDYYGIVRINAEAKHRAYSALRIIDLRIFSYFSRHINLSDGYFITDVMQAILNNRTLVTDSSDIVRDYLHPDDLFSMIGACMKAGSINQAFDVSSSCPVLKQEILDYFASAYGLQYERRSFPRNASATGAKQNYFSVGRMAAQIGYLPTYSSMDSLQHEARIILKKES